MAVPDFGFGREAHSVNFVDPFTWISLLWRSRLK